MTNIEEPKDPFGLNVSTCDGYTASCCEPKQKQEAPQKNLDPSKLGGSGIASKRRSTVTKSILRSGQGGFDDHGDPCKGVSSIVKISSARPSMVASLVSTIVGENKAEEVKKFLFIPITNNVKALFVMMVRSRFAVVSGSINCTMQRISTHDYYVSKFLRCRFCLPAFPLPNTLLQLPLTLFP